MLLKGETGNGKPTLFRGSYWAESEVKEPVDVLREGSEVLRYFDLRIRTFDSPSNFVWARVLTCSLK